MKLIKFFLFFLILSIKFSYAYDVDDFNKWKSNFKKQALRNNISNGSR